MGKLTNLNPPAPIADSDIPPGVARDSEVTTIMNAHLAASDPHSQYLLPSEGDARYRLISTALTDSDIPSGVARDSEVTTIMNAHLAASDPHTQYPTQAEGDARYFRGRSQIHTLDPPSLGAGELYKIFFTFTGAKLGDICLVSPISVNLFSTALWPFRFFGMIESVDTAAVYIHNTHSGPLDVASFQFRVVVFNF